MGRAPTLRAATDNVCAQMDLARFGSTGAEAEVVGMGARNNHADARPCYARPFHTLALVRSIVHQTTPGAELVANDRGAVLQALLQGGPSESRTSTSR